MLPMATAPRTFDEVTNEVWRGKVALAYPMFGTTATHLLAFCNASAATLSGSHGCRALMANKPLLVDGNSIAVKMVGRGEAWIAFTDSDDFAAEQSEGLPVAELPVSSETLYLPNTVGVIRNAPHPAEAEAFYEYLRRPDVAQRMVDAHAHGRRRAGSQSR